MYNAPKFLAKLKSGHKCIGVCMTSTDPTLSEAYAEVSDFVFVDAEHAPLSSETLQLHAMAVRAGDAAMLIRVAWNDPVRVKPLLDLGADGIIFPMIRSAEDVRRAVAACRYPPAGNRGFGPRRAIRFGAYAGDSYPEEADASVLVIPQIEHIDAVEALDGILEVDGVDTLLFGPNDLAASMGLVGQPDHPDVVNKLLKVIGKVHAAGKTIGIASGDDSPDYTRCWLDRGIDWLSQGTEFTQMLRTARALRDAVDQADAPYSE